MATLEDDIRSDAGFNLFELRQQLLQDVSVLTPTQLVDKAIAGTVETLEKQFRFQSIGACESNGDPHYCEGLALYYWDIVNDTGADA